MRTIIVVMCLCCWACSQYAAEGKNQVQIPEPKISSPDAPDSEKAELILAGGCFWCIEGVFEQINGVLDAESGYAGGDPKLAHYKAVCSGATGHAEVVKVTYNPQKVSFATLLHIFFSTHNPTTLNRQGPDRGTQYRSAIFYANKEQHQAAKAYIDQLTAAKVFPDPIVTTLEELKQYHPAEDYHQDFARLNPSHGYILQQSKPKIEKACKLFPEHIKDLVKKANDGK